MAEYTFMSCNIRFQNPNDGVQQFDNRVDFICETLLSLAPDVIGFQEIRPPMRKVLIAKMPGYAFLGAGRGTDRLGESSVIAYRQDRLIPERLSSEMLSNAPHIPGTTYGGDQSSCPRIFSSADFMPIDGGRPFRFMNVHTDHIGQNARYLAGMQMLQSLSAQNALRPMPTVITGDFNAAPDTPEMQIFTNYPGLIDATADIPPTFHAFERPGIAWKIDYIFVTDDWQNVQAESLHPKRGKLCFSDHDPVLVQAELDD